MSGEHRDQKQLGSVTYTYQSYTPYEQNPQHSGGTQFTGIYSPGKLPGDSHTTSPIFPGSSTNTFQIRNPNSYYPSYSYASPSSYSSTIRRIPHNPNDPRPELLPHPNASILNNSSPEYPVPVHQFSSALDSSEGLFPNSRLSYSQISRHFQHDDETIAGRKIFKNPRNVPSEQCPRDEEAARRMVRSWLGHQPSEQVGE